MGLIPPPPFEQYLKKLHNWFGMASLIEGWIGELWWAWVTCVCTCQTYLIMPSDPFQATQTATALVLSQHWPRVGTHGQQ